MNHVMGNRYSTQLGVGLIEVMVALLLLAVAVLGFSAMQLQAVKATDESITRSTAVNAMKNLAEDVRLNSSQKQNYFNLVSGVWSNVADRSVDGYCAQVQNFLDNRPTPMQVSQNGVTMFRCESDSKCDNQLQAEYNSYKSMNTICEADMMMNAIACPGTTTNLRDFNNPPPLGLLPKLCLIASWNETVPEIQQNASNADACIDNTGAYIRGSSCLVMEIY